jgi:hypothetical protein
MLSIIFALLVNVASAETIVLNQMNDLSIPAGFEVTVTTDSTLNTMRVQVTSCPTGWTVQGIDKVFYNLDGNSGAYAVTHVDGALISSTSWLQNVGTTNAAEFGDFASGNVADSAGTSTDIIFTLFDMATIPVNDKGHKVAVHMRLHDGTGIEIADASTWITDTIPEFPTIAVPITAILGLMFIIRNRRKEE